jgi:hypothetical protein
MDNEEDLIKEENRRIRLLRIASDLLVQVLMTNPVTVPEAERLVDGVRRFALKLFPGKEGAFDLIYVPRFRRAFHEGGGYERSQGPRIVDGADPTDDPGSRL